MGLPGKRDKLSVTSLRFEYLIYSFQTFKKHNDRVKVVENFCSRCSRQSRRVVDKYVR